MNQASSPGLRGLGVLLVVATSGAFAGGCGEAAGSAEAVLARARELAGRHRVVEALGVIERYAAARPRRRELSDAEAELWEKWAALLLNASRPEAAAEVLAELRRAGRFRPHLAPLRAEALLEQGSYSEALAAFQALSPLARLGVLSGYAKAALGAGRAGEGAAIAAAALLRDPWLEEAYLVLGRSLTRLRRRAVAEAFLARYRDGEAFREAEVEAVELEYRGLEARAALQRARAERARGRLYEAMQLANQALKEDPALGSALVELAELSVFLERPWDAIHQLEKLPAHASVLAALAAAFEAAGDPDRAAATYRTALQKDPENGAHAAALARLESRAGPEASAPADPLGGLRLEVARRIRDRPLSESVPELRRVAATCARLERLDEARDLGLFLVQLKPRDSGLRIEVASFFRRPEDAFVRFYLLAPVPAAEQRSEIDRELARLGLRADLVRRALAGESIVD